MMTSRTACVPACLGLLLLAAGCRAARMELPADLAAVEPMAVEGRQGLKIREALRFGPYDAAEVRRSWTGGGGLRINEYSRERRTQRYAFTLREGGSARWTVACDAWLFVQGFDVLGVTVTTDDRSTLDCRLEPAGGGDAGGWRLELAEERERPLRGVLSGPGGRYDVAGTNRIEGGRVPAGQTTGYELHSGGRVVGAVEVINEGGFRVRPDIEPSRRTLLAAAAAALLLLEDLRATIEDAS